MHFALKNNYVFFCERVQAQLFGGNYAAEAATEIPFDFQKWKIRFPDFEIWPNRTFLPAQLSVFKKEK